MMLIKIKDVALADRSRPPQEVVIKTSLLIRQSCSQHS
jgi:hypothetical protein